MFSSQSNGCWNVISCQTFITWPCSDLPSDQFCPPLKVISPNKNASKKVYFLGVRKVNLLGFPRETSFRKKWMELLFPGQKKKTRTTVATVFYYCRCPCWCGERWWECTGLYDAGLATLHTQHYWKMKPCHRHMFVFNNIYDVFSMNTNEQHEHMFLKLLIIPSNIVLFLLRDHVDDACLFNCVAQDDLYSKSDGNCLDLQHWYQYHISKCSRVLSHYLSKETFTSPRLSQVLLVRFVWHCWTCSFDIPNITFI